MLSSTKRAIGKVRSILRGPAGTRRSALRKLVSTRAQRATKRARRKVVSGQMRVVGRSMGQRAANSYFWTSPIGATTWPEVRARIEALWELHPDHLDHFVTVSLQRTADPITVVSMAQHPYSRAAVARWLTEECGVTTGPLVDRLAKDALLGGAVAGAASVVLGPDEARRTVDWVLGLYAVPDHRTFQFLDSVGMRQVRGTPNAAAERPLPGRPARHRLIISDQFQRQPGIPLLLPGSERVTLLALAETFGKANFARYRDWPGVGEIKVEHVRSRITRFSQQYIDIHLATARLADLVCAEVAAVPGLIDDEDRRFLAVEIADFLFFQTLKIRAVEELLADEDIDQVVFALGTYAATHNFPRLMAGVRGLFDDRRVEFVSAAQAANTRAAFWNLIDGMLDPQPPGQAPGRRLPLATVVRAVDADTARLAKAMPAPVADGRPSVLVATTNNGAYNDSTARYVAELRGDYAVRVVHVGSSVGQLPALLAEAGVGDLAIDELAIDRSRLSPLADVLMALLKDRLPEQPSDPDDAAASAGWWALRYSLDRVAREVIASAVARMRMTHHWFAAMQTAGQLPNVVVLTPSRNVNVGALASTARRFGVPSIVLEPHAQDANYSRYIKIAGDFYGVMSDYFRAQAISGFETDPARTFIIGSPRQVAPADYDPVAAQDAARAEFAATHELAFTAGVVNLVFFCQPSDWNHVSVVWGHILEAARRTGSRILLKTHPEESVTRTEGYMVQAAESAMADAVVLLDGDAAEAIALADLVLTAYSAAALDAAVRQRPVICVTDGDLRYPVDLTAIIGAPVARSADDLAALIVRFQQHPEEFEEQARLLLEREAQFVDGPGPRLRTLVADVLARGPEALRETNRVPQSLFLDGPHPLFPV